MHDWTLKDKTMPGAVQDEIEALVDRYGLAMILGSLANICAEKSAHLASNWQDTRTAKVWIKAMTVCDNASLDEAVETVSE